MKKDVEALHCITRALRAKRFDQDGSVSINQTKLAFTRAPGGLPTHLRSPVCLCVCLCASVWRARARSVSFCGCVCLCVGE